MRNRHSGFSLIELLVVIAIIMVVAAIATPSIINAVNGIRLRSAASEVAGIIQQDRQLAVRNNRYYTVKPLPVAAGAPQGAYVDLNYNDTFDGGAPAPEPMIQFPQSISVVSVGAPNTANLFASAFSPGTVPQAASILPSFNSRGLPCVGAANPPLPNALCSIRDAAGSTVGFVYYLSQVRPFGAVGWAAVTVTPAGRIRVWTYSGTTWQ